MKKIAITTLSLIALLSSSLSAQIYKCSTISESMKENAKAVIRNYDMRTIVYEPGKMKVFTKIAMTILNESADEYSQILLHYDKFSKISDIEATVYDKDGVKIKKIKSGDFKDYSTASGYSLLEDNRALYYHYTYNNYPYTIEYSYTTNYNGYMNLDDFFPQSRFDFSVEKARASYSIPLNMKFMYYQNGTKIKPEETSTEKHKTYTFQLDSLQAIEEEPLMIDELNVQGIYATTDRFKMDEYDGKLESWSDFGEFITQLHQDRDELSPERTAEIKNLVAGISDKKEIVKKVYQYMQNRTRYVSIQLGIGGWQPFSARIVDKVGYGDCKALSNYTKALLKCAGIKAVNAVVRASKHANYTKKEFIVNQFNHQILCVPLESDTIWLECTSQVYPMGYLGNFTDDRYALLIEGKDSKLVKTKTYRMDDSKQIMNINTVLDKDGNAVTDLKVSSNGIQYTNYERLLTDNNSDDQRKIVNYNLEVTNNDISAITAKSDGEPNPTIHVTVKMKVNKYANVSSNRFFLPLNMANKNIALPSYKKRKFDFEIRRAVHDIDTVTYTLPEGYHVESKPKNVELKSEYGEYTSKVEVIDNKVIYTRDNKIFKFSKKAEKYGEFFQFAKKVAEMDNAKLVLIK